MLLNVHLLVVGMFTVHILKQVHFPASPPSQCTRCQSLILKMEGVCEVLLPLLGFVWSPPAENPLQDLGGFSFCQLWPKLRPQSIEVAWTHALCFGSDGERAGNSCVSTLLHGEDVLEKVKGPSVKGVNIPTVLLFLSPSSHFLFSMLFLLQTKQKKAKIFCII